MNKQEFIDSIDASKFAALKFFLGKDSDLAPKNNYVQLFAVGNHGHGNHQIIVDRLSYDMQMALLHGVKCEVSLWDGTKAKCMEGIGIPQGDSLSDFKILDNYIPYLNIKHSDENTLAVEFSIEKK